jgi:hypothetical protein
MLAGALVVGLLVFTTAVAAGAIGHGHRKAACRRRAVCGFTIHGNIKRLYPGVHRRLKLVVHNPGRRRLTVRRITTRVRGGNAACRARDLHVSAFRGRIRVRPHRSRRIRVKIWMRAGSPTSCEGHVFRLAFRGRATG